RFFGADSLGRYYMLQRASLSVREYSAVNLFCQFFSREDQTAPRSPESLVCGCRHYVGMAKWRRMSPSRHKSGNMSHIHHEISSRLPGDLREGGKINDTRIRGSSGKDKLRPELTGFGAYIFHVYIAFFVYVIKYHVIEFSAEIDSRPV